MIHSETYRIRNFEADTNGKLWLPSLANYLQDAADRHATELGVGVPHLMEKGLSWVLHRMRIDIHRWPDLSEEITVTTNPSGEEKVYIYRDYRVFDDDKNLIVSATSTWLVFDMAKRKLTVPSLDIKQKFEPYRNMQHFDRASQRYPPMPTLWQYQTEVKARYNEIDQNLHVNNSVYFQWLLEPLPVSYLQVKTCSSLDITFKAESVRGEVIRSLCTQLSDNLLIHRLENERGEEIVTAVTSWV